MAARALWTGQLRLALVSIPVEVYAATRSAPAVSFHQIHKPTGQRIHYRKVADGVGEVDQEDIVKGYEIARGDYVLLDDEEIDAVRIESRRTLELVRFVALDAIPPAFYERPCYVVPADQLAVEGYTVLRDALASSRRAGLGQLAVRGREELVALRAEGRGLMLEILRYGEEVADPAPYFRDLSEDAPKPDLLDLATSLIDRLAGGFDPAQFHDGYVDALHRLIEKKAKAGGRKRIIEDTGDKTPRGGNVIDLMAALKKSLGGDDEHEPRRKRSRRHGAQARSARDLQSQARFYAYRRTGRQSGQGLGHGTPLRCTEACRTTTALGFPARNRGRAGVLGGHARAERGS